MAIINNTWSIEHFQLKYKTAEEWANGSKDYILAAGEIGLEIDTGKAKLGDGVKKFSELDYYSDPVLKGLIDALTLRVNQTESDIADIKSRLDSIEGVTTISVNPVLASDPEQQGD